MGGDSYSFKSASQRSETPSSQLLPSTGKAEHGGEDFRALGNSLLLPTASVHLADEAGASLLMRKFNPSLYLGLGDVCADQSHG